MEVSRPGNHRLVFGCYTCSYTKGMRLMAQVGRYIDVEGRPDLARVANEVRTTQEPCVLQHNDEAIAVVIPAKAPRKRQNHAKAVTREDALFRLIGIGESTVPGGVSSRKHERLAEIYHSR